MISFDPLWETMKNREISQYNLIKDYGFSTGQLDRIRKNRYVNTHTIDSLCKILKCEISDIIIYIPDNNE